MPEQNILYLTNGSPSYMPPLRLAPQQVEMGPNMPDQDCADGRIRRHLEAGEVASETLLRRLPQGFMPDLVFVQVSSYRCAKPVELAVLPGRKILVVADTHPRF